MWGQKENQHAFLKQSQLEFHKTVRSLACGTSVKWRPPGKYLQLNACQEIVQDSQRILNWAIFVTFLLSSSDRASKSDIQSGLTNWTEQWVMRAESLYFLHVTTLSV
jgi:hypothetical protein